MYNKIFFTFHSDKQFRDFNIFALYLCNHTSGKTQIWNSLDQQHRGEKISERKPKKNFKRKEQSSTFEGSDFELNFQSDKRRHKFRHNIRKTGGINNPLGQPTAPAAAGSDCRLILKFWDGRTDRRMDTLCGYSDHYRPGLWSASWVKNKSYR